MWTTVHPDPIRDWAESGIASLTGRPDGPLLIPPGRAATVARERTAWIADVTGGAVALDGARLLAERAAFTGHRRSGATSPGGSCRLLPTADGWAAVSCARLDDPLLLGALVGADIGDDPWPAVEAWLREHAGSELEERAELLGVAAGPVAAPQTPAPEPYRPLAPRPVSGRLVVDFSALWAGPLCAHLLSLAGARVVKVETPSRPDGARRGNPDFYHLLHGGHDSVMLDPTLPGDRNALATLVAAADIVIEASRPRALIGFGLDAADFVANGGTWVSITAHGRTSNRVGFGDDIAATAGLVGYTHGGPVFVGDAIADPLTGLTAAALAMSAPADGGGVLWDVAMSSVVAATLTSTGTGVAQPYRSQGRWYVDTPTVTVELAEPRPRPPRGNVAESGRDTTAVLTELGITR
ncbi:CoA transferase [Rhodococcus sp. NPDC056960]|uniref:CoA transferase n=1 Tax=Rhodococcus sp. NPDC056960 TaxID=3345982 RepID=UPI003644C2AC